jgi:hypothetical protein
MTRGNIILGTHGGRTEIPGGFGPRTATVGSELAETGGVVVRLGKPVGKYMNPDEWMEMRRPILRLHDLNLFVFVCIKRVAFTCQKTWFQ